MTELERYHRRSIRLPGYDYAQARAYFVTIVTQGRARLFGDVVYGDTMRLNAAGEMVVRWWSELGPKYPPAVPDTCIVMPNHVHGILILHPEIVGADPRVCPHASAQATTVGADLRVCPRASAQATTVGADLRVCPRPPEGAHTGAPLPDDDTPLSQMVQWFKTMTTNAYIHGVKEHGWPPFSGRLWQRNYYEHVIRNETSLHYVHEYIASNPSQWAYDRENPATLAPEPKEAWLGRKTSWQGAPGSPQTQ